MTDTSALTELANFVSRSPLGANETGRSGINALAVRLAPRSERRGVGDMLAAVMALSARTRRMVMPHARVEIDVYAPGGKRAVDLVIGKRLV